MASSRIFVKSLPPTFTEDEFRKHFSQNGKREVTDAKLFQRRRIGYVGFKTPEEAQQAVKFFNKTFIRMSRIGVEIATPIDETNVSKGRVRAPTSRVEQVPQASTPAVPENPMKRKRDTETKEEQDPKLKEFLEVMRPKSKKKALEENPDSLEAGLTAAHTTDAGSVPVVEADSDSEYEDVAKPTKVPRVHAIPTTDDEHNIKNSESNLADTADPASDHPTDEPTETTTDRPAVSDSDWLRSRTSRLLGLLDDDEEAMAVADVHPEEESDVEDNKPAPMAQSPFVQNEDKMTSSMPTPESQTDEAPLPPVDKDIETVRSTMRLFVRNLPYDIKSEDLEAEFSAYGNLEEIHIPLDSKTGTAKGFAFVQYTDPDSAEQALVERDGRIFQGRLIHVLPSAAPRTNKADEFELAKLPLKKQQLIKKKREADSKTFNWNSLYMNADAVVAIVADRLGLSKSEVLDPTSSDAAVRQAHAETHVIQETKAYFKKQGVDLDSFKKRQRGDTAILVKNIPYDVSRDELKQLLGENGEIKRLAVPPTGAIAIVEYSNEAQCKSAWKSLAYRRVKSTVLLLEKAPKDVFASGAVDTSDEAPVAQEGVEKVSASELRDTAEVVADTAGTATLFVRNLNFTTTSELLTDTFKSFDGFLSARVKTKTDPKKPGQILSMGFGFLEFRSASQAQVALKVMDDHVLEGHKLQIRASHKGADAADEKRKAGKQKASAAQSTKVIIKNLPFEATKKDLRALFGAYGQLRSVRMPKKIDHSTRGFAFADFMTTKEAQNAMESLRDTHLLGRRLVLDFAAEDPADAEAEIEKMQQKVGAQVNKVALQKLTSGGRKKFTTQAEEDLV